MRLYDSASGSSLQCDACEDCVQMKACKLAEEGHLQMQHNERIRDRVNLYLQSGYFHIAYSAAVSLAVDAVCSAECSRRPLIFYFCIMQD